MASMEAFVSNNAVFSRVRFQVDVVCEANSTCRSARSAVTLTPGAVTSTMVVSTLLFS